jgi:hypothetical protein
VKEILLMRGWWLIACPTVWPKHRGMSDQCVYVRWKRVPYPLTMLMTPGGNPASWTRLANLRAVSGVISDGLVPLMSIDREWRCVLLSYLYDYGISSG